MKKTKLLILAPLAVGAITLGTVQGLSNAKSNDVELSTAITSNFTYCLKQSYELKTDYVLNYDSYRFLVIDQVSEDYRSNSIYYSNYLLQDLRYVKNGAGETEEEYINLQNEVKTRRITDEEGNGTSFDKNYGNPFKTLSNLNNSKINSYFDVSLKDSSYVLKANELAYGILNNPISSFFLDFDGFIWDNSTLVHNIENFELVIDSDGTPLSLSFDKIKKDRFGAIKETLTSEFKNIDEVKHLSPVAPKMTAEQSSILREKLDSYQEELNKGNFTETFSILQDQITYSNFYDMDYKPGDLLPNMMLSNCELYDASYGLTYVGLMETSEGYQQYAISPEAGFASTMNNDVYPNLTEVIPNIAAISTDFFTYNNGKYVFDIESFVYADVYFCAEILTSFMSFIDPGVAFLGIYLSNYSYEFRSLAIEFDNDGNLNGVLTYVYEQAYILESKFSFHDIGTTDLTKEESLSAPVTFLLSQL